MIIKASSVYYVTKHLLYHCVMSDELQPIAKNPLFLVHPKPDFITQRKYLMFWIYFSCHLPPFDVKDYTRFISPESQPEPGLRKSNI